MDDKLKYNILPTGLQVSYSAIDTYLSCGEKYRLERILKIVPESINTAFMFGKAIDQASEVIFKPFMKDGIKFDRNTMLQVFKDSLTTIDYQGEDIHAPTCLKVKYSKTDVQAELLEKEDFVTIQKFIDESILEVTNIRDFIDYYKDTKIKVADETLIYNFIAWHCLYRKGIMMLDALKKWADDNILEVVSLQRKIEIVNDFGDKLIGFLDLEARLKRDGILRTIDLKTASKPKTQYPDDKISKSMQLAIYSEFTQRDVGYIVVSKDIKKREPRVEVRELYGVISEIQADEVFEKIDEAMEGIRAEKFEKNTDACWRYGKCFAYDYCTKGSMQGLVPRVKREENGK
jgi:hypothetical protein